VIKYNELKHREQVRERKEASNQLLGYDRDMSKELDA